MTMTNDELKALVASLAISQAQTDKQMKKTDEQICEMKHEMDIFLVNGESVGIVEVKNQVKDKSLEQLTKIVDKFYYFHPEFKNYKIVPAIAGKIFPEYIQNKALKMGFTVITQVGNHTEQKNP